MANALGTLTPTAVVQRALELVYTGRPLLKMITMDTADLGGGNTALFNQPINTRILAVPTVANFGTGAAETAYTNVQVTLDQFKEVHFAFTPQEYNSTSRDLLDEAAEPCAVAIYNHLIDAIAAKWVIGTFTNATTVASGWTYTNTILPIRNALAARRKVSDGGIFFACSAAVYGALLADTTMVAALNNPANAAAISTGKSAAVAGIMPIEYPAIPNTGNMVGFAGTKDTVVLANRVPTNPETLVNGVKYPGTFDVVTDPTSGLSVVVNTYIGQGDLKANYRVLLMYGIAAGNPTNGQILKTA